MSKVSEKEVNKIIELTLKGLNRKEISKKLNRSKDTIWRYQKKFCYL